MELLEQSLGRPVQLRCLEDNTQCLQAAETGYSAVLRHLPRTERISVGVVHETFSEKSHQIAFERALTLINLVRPDGSKYKAE